MKRTAKTFLLAAAILLPSYSFSPRHLHGTAIVAMSSKSADEKDGYITILGLGSLLSKRSSQMTFPDLVNFRLGRVPNYRRVFGHPAPIFFQKGIANAKTLEMSSLSAEFVDGHAGFCCAIFEVPNKDMMQDGMPSKAYLEREEEFDIIQVPYVDLETGKTCQGGVLCARSTDEAYLERWGKERFAEHYLKYDIKTIWGWSYDSGLLPCAAYLRHCTLAAESLGPECYISFLDETFLADRTTTIRMHLKENPQIMTTLPPPELAVRYGG